MKKNVGNVDRIIRLVVGVSILSTTVVGPQTLWGLVGIVPILTAFISFCPLYLPLGINTCGMKKS